MVQKELRHKIEDVTLLALGKSYVLRGRSFTNFCPCSSYRYFCRYIAYEVSREFVQLVMYEDSRNLKHNPKYTLVLCESSCYFSAHLLRTCTVRLWLNLTGRTIYNVHV